MSNMTLREKLELAAYRLRALAPHMPTEWQQKVAFGWADDAMRAAVANRSASAIETRSAKTEGLGPQDESAVPQDIAQGTAS